MKRIITEGITYDITEKEYEELEKLYDKATRWVSEEKIK